MSVWKHPTLTRASFEFCQDENTLGTTASPAECETIKVFCEYQMPGDPGDDQAFYVIETKGWSIDGPTDLQNLLHAVKEAEKTCRSSLPRS